MMKCSVQFDNTKQQSDMNILNFHQKYFSVEQMFCADVTANDWLYIIIWYIYVR